MDYEEFAKMIEKSTQRRLRFYACAVAGAIQHLGRTNSVRRAVVLGEEMAAYRISWEDTYEVRRLEDHLKSLVEKQDDFVRRTVREAALLCVGRDVSCPMFKSVVNAVRRFRGENFDDDIAACIRPDYDRRSTGSRNPEVLAMAHRCYDKEDWAAAGPLSDAIEEAGMFTERHLLHLRQDCHWRGCWVIDEVLGIWGA